MSAPGRPKGEYRSAQREGRPVSVAPADTLAIEALHVALDADAGLVRAIDG